MKRLLTFASVHFFESTEKVKVWSKIESKERLSFAKSVLKYLFNGKLCKQVDGVIMGAHLGLTLTNAFLVYFEKNLLQNCPLEFKSYYHQHYVDQNAERLEANLNFCDDRHYKMSFTTENEREN